MVFDCGVNICSKQYNNYIDTLVDHSIDAKLSGWILISNNFNEWKKNKNIIDLYNNKLPMYMTLGIHPHNARFGIPNTFEENITENIIAIGECGLDYNRMFSSKAIQIKVFRHQIELAKKYNKPLYLHERDAFDDFYSIISKENNIKGIIHCFTGNLEQMNKYLNLGFYIGITGIICNKNTELVNAVKYLPLDKLIIETDSPFMTPYMYSAKWKTKRNQPDAIWLVIIKLAEIFNVSEDIIIQQTVENTKKLFNLS